MKKRLLSRLAGIAIMSLLATQVDAQTPRNPRSQLPQNFRQDKQIEYNRLETQEVTFPVFYDIEEVRYFHDDALRLDPSIGYDIVRPVLLTQCGNGDFEERSLSPQWQGAHGSVSSTGQVLYGSFVAGINSGAINLPTSRQTLVTTATDPNVPILTTAPGSNQAVRIGNSAAGNGAELLSKTFVVTQPLISFWYALVLQDPGHIPSEQAGFRVRILDAVTGVEIPNLINLGNGRDSAFADGSNPFFIRRNGIVYRDWSCATIDFSRHVGRRVTVQFVTKDCAQSGHFGYAYVDNFCGTCRDPWNIRFGSASECGPGKICFDYTLPPTTGTSTGNLNITLNIYQNGSLVTTLTSGLLTSGTSYCFGINPTALGLNPALGGFDFTAVGNFGLGAPGNLAPQFVFTAPDGQDPGLNNDYFISCGCCPGNNLIRNPGFENGNTDFASDYIYQGTISAGSIGVGNYGVVTDAQAAAVASTWSPICPSTGRHLVVNGATGLSTIKTVWKQTVNVKEGATYKFCFDVKKLPPCAFDGKTSIRVVYQAGSLNETNTHSIAITPGACNWTKIEKSITIPAGATSLTIAIMLNENMIGDGNDLAFDNLSLVTMQPVATSQLLFGMTPFNVVGSTYNMTVSASSAMAQDCQHFWQVEELDAFYNPILTTQVVNPFTWSSLGTHNFPGYVGTSLLTGSGNGVFQLNKTYRIIYGRSCKCESLSKRYMIVGPLAAKGVNGTNMPQILETGIYDETVKGGRVPTAVKEANANQVKVFPNPTKNTVNVQVAVAGDEYQVKVFNSFGQLVKSADIRGGQTSTEISLAELASGNYMLHVVSDKGAMVHTERVTKL